MTTKQISKAPPPITPVSGSYIPKPPLAPMNPPADYETWCKADLWTIRRGILLLLEVEEIPQKCTSFGEVYFEENYKAIADRFNKIWKVAESSIEEGVLNKRGKGFPTEDSKVSPSDFIAWAKLKNYAIPPQLELIKPVTQAETVNNQNHLLKKETTKNDMTETERNTMLKLIIGMAIDAYGYEPDKPKNSASGNNKNSISAKLQTRGISISDDTIRKYLTEAKNIL
jgi:hypothetical protein